MRIFDEGLGFTGFFEALSIEEIKEEANNPHTIIKILVDPQTEEIISCSWGSNYLRKEVIDNTTWETADYADKIKQLIHNDQILEWRELVKSRSIDRNSTFSTGQLTMLEMVADMLKKDPHKTIGLYEIFVIEKLYNHVGHVPIVATFIKDKDNPDRGLANTSQQAVHNSLNSKNVGSKRVGSRQLPNFLIGRYEYERRSDIYELDIATVIPHLIELEMLDEFHTARVLGHHPLLVKEMLESDANPKYEIMSLIRHSDELKEIFFEYRSAQANAKK